MSAVAGYYETQTFREDPALLEFYPVEASVREAEYAHSTSTIHYLGEAAVRGLSSYERHRDLAYDDFRTAVVEMINSDEEFGKHLDVENGGVHAVVDGRARSHTGRPMVEVIRKGAIASRKLALQDPVYESQAVRDECDVPVAEWADTLQVGETLVGVSMAPLGDLQQYPAAYKQLGYAELLYIQAFVRTEDAIRTFSFSADASRPDAWRQVLARHGMVIPEDESDNTWLRHAMVTELSEAETPAFLQTLRGEYYQSIGQTGKRLSATEYANQHDELLQTIFDTYYVPMAEANYLGQNNQTMRDFAGALLDRDIKQLEPSIRRQLIRINNAQRFDDESTKTMDKLIRYAAAEQLRKGISHFVSSNHQSPRLRQYENLPSSMASPVIDPLRLHQMLAGNVQAGAVAGREYLGCAGNVNLTGNSSDSNGENAGRNPQEAYGGRSGEESEAGGKRYMSCPYCSATVYGDPCAKRLACPDCRALVLNGKVVSTGDGGSRARAVQAKEAERARRAKAADKFKQAAQAARERKKTGETRQKNMFTLAA